MSPGSKSCFISWNTGMAMVGHLRARSFLALPDFENTRMMPPIVFLPSVPIFWVTRSIDMERLTPPIFNLVVPKFRRFELHSPYSQLLFRYLKSFDGLRREFAILLFVIGHALTARLPLERNNCVVEAVLDRPITAQVLDHRRPGIVLTDH
jgi:hypothetical protein